MNVYLTPAELLYAFEAIVQKPHEDQQVHESLLLNLRRPILDALEEKQEKIDEDLYVAWSESESRKIEELARKNMSINSSKTAVMRASSSRK